MELDTIQSRIYELRGQRIMLDYDLAELYEVETKVLKQAVRRNIDRFPSDFMFELTAIEFHSLRSQIVTSKRGGARYMPFAFTEQGVAMLSSVLNSTKAIQVNITIIRAFVMLRQFMLDHKGIKDKIEKLESEMNRKFQDISEALNYLLDKDMHQERKRIGFKRDEEE